MSATLPRYRPRVVRAYYEDLWERLPAELSPPDFALRLRFLRRHLKAEDRVLDIGCGDGAFSGEIAKVAASVLGADVAETALARARRRHPGLAFRRVEPDAELPFEDGSFDAVWASEVIEHVADTGLWLAEIRRVLTTGGRLLVTTPSHGRLRLLARGIEAFSPPLGDHLHLYTPRSLRDTLQELGFVIRELRGVGGAPGARRMILACATVG